MDVEVELVAVDQPKQVLLHGGEDVVRALHGRNAADNVLGEVNVGVDLVGGVDEVVAGCAFGGLHRTNPLGSHEVDDVLAVIQLVNLAVVGLYLVEDVLFGERVNAVDDVDGVVGVVRALNEFALDAVHAAFGGGAVVVAHALIDRFQLAVVVNLLLQIDFHEVAGDRPVLDFVLPSGEEGHPGVVHSHG